jgi:hypothetical protein
MDLYRIIGELVKERDRLQRIIESLESVEGTTDKPGRVRRTARGRKSMDAAGRREVSERMKLYWAKRREQRGEDSARRSQ